MALIIFPFTFLSSAYIPVRTTPGPLQTFATHQPITDMVNAVRTLTEGQAAETLLGHSAAYWIIRYASLRAIEHRLAGDRTIG